jgi:hypothetical protein
MTRYLVPFFAIVLMSCTPVGHSKATGAWACSPNASPLQWPASLPVYDHIVIVVEENKNYEEVIGKPEARFINQVLKAEGASFTHMFGEEHPSQGNYFWIFSGSNQTVGFMDEPPPDPLMADNLGAQLLRKGLSFKGYSESLPAIGSTVKRLPEDCRGDKCIYARKHVPWISFANLPNGTTVSTSSNLRFEDFPSDSSQFQTLPRVSFVIPNLWHDMHNGTILEDSVRRGDQWLETYLNPYYQWAKTHHSLLILTFDENNNKEHYKGLTNPAVTLDPQHPDEDEYRRDITNRIVTIFAGAHIKPGEYLEDKGITHINVLRTIEAMYGLCKSGAQQPNAAGIGITDDFTIKDVFVPVR